MRRPWPYGLSKNILKSVRALGFRVVGFRGLGSRVVTFVAGWFDSKTTRPPPECAKLPEVPMMLSVCFLVCFPKFGFFKKISEVKG